MLGTMASSGLPAVRPDSQRPQLIAETLCSLRIGFIAESRGEIEAFLCFRCSASIPFSVSSTSMRVALSHLDFAIVRTFEATLGGKLTLWRTVLLPVFITPSCPQAHDENRGI